MTKDEALKMCLEYIEKNAHERKYVRHAIKAALEAKDEPVACSMCNEWEKVCDQHLRYINKLKKKRTWVGLTEDEQTRLFTDWDEDEGWGPFIEAIEAKLKEKNT